MTLVINSKYKHLIPPLSPEEYNSLKESIKSSGQWIPIIINNDNEILDGHHRYRICEELGIKSKTIKRIFTTKTDEIIFVGECNLNRRQLTTLQRINLVRLLEPYYLEQAQNRIKSGKKADPVEIFPQGKTRDVMGQKAGVSGKTYEKAKQVLEDATTDDIEKINKGEKSISSVYSSINESNHFKTDLKKPYSFSISTNIIEDIQYYKKTTPKHNLDKKIEDFIMTIVPHRTK